MVLQRTKGIALIGALIMALTMLFVSGAKADYTDPDVYYHEIYNTKYIGWSQASGTVSANARIDDTTLGISKAGANVNLKIVTLSGATVRTGADYISNLNGYAYPSVSTAGIAQGSYKVQFIIEQPDGAHPVIQEYSITL